MVFASDDVVFAWAIAKASLVVIVSFGTLVYAAWAASKVLFNENGATEEAEEARSILDRTPAEEVNVEEPTQPAAAA
jgi:hypothetical protein